MNQLESTYHHRVLDFLYKNPRNRLIIIPYNLEEIRFIDLNIELAYLFKDEILNSRFSLKAKDLISALLNKSIQSNDLLGDYLAISGIGVLIEEQLMFDFKSFLDQYSQNQTLLLKWRGEIKDNKLYFLTKKNGLEIDISNLSHIVL